MSDAGVPVTSDKDLVDLEKQSNDSTRAIPDENTNPDEAQLESKAENPETEENGEAPDPNLVGWDGDNDPANPLNWTALRRYSNVGMMSLICFITPLGSSMFAPSISQVMEDFQSTNLELASFVVSIYILGYAVGPLFLAPLSELYGRVPLYHSCNILFVIFTIACAVSKNLNMLIGFRFLAGCVGGVPLTNGGGTITDLIVQEKRGTSMAVFSLGPLIGPVVGPVAGGFLAQAKGWRWVFWVLAIIVPLPHSKSRSAPANCHRVEPPPLPAS